MESFPAISPQAWHFTALDEGGQKTRSPARIWQRHPGVLQTPRNLARNQRAGVFIGVVSEFRQLVEGKFPYDSLEVPAEAPGADEAGEMQQDSSRASLGKWSGRFHNMRMRMKAKPRRPAKAHKDGTLEVWISSGPSRNSSRVFMAVELKVFRGAGSPRGV